MAELKTKVNDAPVGKFLASVKDETQQKNSQQLLKMLGEITKQAPKMWGTSIVGFGTFHYKGASGREGDWFLTGFSPRKQNMTVYFCKGFAEVKPLLKKLGKHKTTMGCLYFKSLADIDIKVLKQMLKDYYKAHSKK
jgi:nucleoid DNA-binding protein